MGKILAQENLDQLSGAFSNLNFLSQIKQARFGQRRVISSRKWKTGTVG
jgi:hypothetical protein